jgi:hypothetical protein
LYDFLLNVPLRHCLHEADRRVESSRKGYDVKETIQLLYDFPDARALLHVYVSALQAPFPFLQRSRSAGNRTHVENTSSRMIVFPFMKPCSYFDVLFWNTNFHIRTQPAYASIVCGEIVTAVCLLCCSFASIDIAAMLYAAFNPDTAQE